MLISDKHNFIFIHNPKCAGTSIFKALLPYSNFMCRFALGQGHLPSQIGYYSRLLFGEHKLLSNFRYHISASDLQNIVGADVWNQYYTFGVVRNPYDRLVSNFKYIRAETRHDDRDHYEKYESFKHFVSDLKNMPWKDHQHHYLVADGKLAVKKVLRFEQLENDFKEVLKNLDLNDVKLLKINTSQRKPDYLSYYDPEMIKIVNDIFDKDFSYFGYSKIIV